MATGLKRIKVACDKARCRVEFEIPDDGFVVVFYRHGTQKLSGTAQKTAQKEEKIKNFILFNFHKISSRSDGHSFPSKSMGDRKMSPMKQ